MHSTVSGICSANINISYLLQVLFFIYIAYYQFPYKQELPPAFWKEDNLYIFLEHWRLLKDSIRGYVIPWDTTLLW